MHPATATLTGTSTVLTKPAATVNPGAAVTVGGKLTKVGGVALTGVKVRLEELRSDKKAWTTVATVTTTDDGAWTRSIKPSVTAKYRATYPGGAGLLGSVSAVQPVAVRYAVTAKASNTKPKAKKKISITGVVKPGRAGTVVVLQRLVGTKWVKLTTAKTKANGGYTISRAFTKGTWKLRVLVPTTKYNAERASTTLTVKAK